MANGAESYGDEVQCVRYCLFRADRDTRAPLAARARLGASISSEQRERPERFG
jgi:hypothetical protein